MLNSLYIKAYIAVMDGMNFCKKKLKSERGDTNFISIIIILGIVILLAGLFIGFKEQIVGEVTEIVSGFSVQKQNST